MAQHVTIKIYGVVQGVFFRYHSQKTAERLGITGWVSNQDDGSVLIEAEGEMQLLQQLIAWCHQGPSGAIVDKVETTFSPKLRNSTRFEITY